MNNLFDLSEKVAIVTGASSGLGADAALAYAESGANVVLIARRIEKLEAIKQKIEQLGQKGLVLQADVTNEADVKNSIEKVIASFGKIDILLNNAGVAYRGSVENTTTETWNHVMEVNVKGPFLMSKYTLPYMRKANYGKIINIASINAVLGDKNPTMWRHVYNTSKSALHGLTIGMAASYAQENITVNTIGPGLFKTEMTKNSSFNDQQFLKEYAANTPASRTGRDGELNGSILFFSSDASSYVTGQFIAVDGGLTIV